jgi:hypothetical protein
VVSVTPRPCFTPDKELPVPIGQEAVWASELVWLQRLEEKIFSSSDDADDDDVDDDDTRLIIISSWIRRRRKLSVPTLFIIIRSGMQVQTNFRTLSHTTSASSPENHVWYIQFKFSL